MTKHLQMRTIPIKRTARKIRITGILNAVSALSTKRYSPSKSRIKLPDIPGRIIAQIAIQPQRKMYHN